MVDFYDKMIATTDISGHYDTVHREYNGPKYLGEHLKSYGTSFRTVLDVGAGSGYVALELRKFLSEDVQIDALEPSVEMLKVAKKYGIYTKVYMELMNGLQSTTIDTESYDCVCGSGIFVPNHLPAEAIEEMIRLTKINGITAFIMRESYMQDPAYKDKLDRIINRLEEDGVVKKEAIVAEIPNYFADHKGLLFVLRKIYSQD